METINLFLKVRITFSISGCVISLVSTSLCGGEA